MSTIEIPFSYEMAVAIIDGEKVATTRREAKGQIGDTFTVEEPRPHVRAQQRHEPTFRLIEIMNVGLVTARDFYFRLEGFDSPEAFEKTWRSLHRGHFTTGKLYYIHFFGRVV